MNAVVANRAKSELSASVTSALDLAFQGKHKATIAALEAAGGKTGMVLEVAQPIISQK